MHLCCVLTACLLFIVTVQDIRSQQQLTVLYFGISPSIKDGDRTLLCFYEINYLTLSCPSQFKSAKAA